MNIPDEILQAYAAIVRNTQNESQAAAHLQNFVLDVQLVEKTIADAVQAAQQRAQGQ